MGSAGLDLCVRDTDFRLLLAPYLRKFGEFTVPDFIGERYCSRLARVVAVICLVCISFTYVAGQMRNEVYVNRDIMVLATPEIAGLPGWVIALFAFAVRAATPATPEAVQRLVENIRVPGERVIEAR